MIHSKMPRQKPKLTDELKTVLDADKEKISELGKESGIMAALTSFSKFFTENKWGRGGLGVVGGLLALSGFAKGQQEGESTGVGCSYCRCCGSSTCHWR